VLEDDDSMTAVALPVRVDIGDWLDIEVPVLAVAEPDSVSVKADGRELSLQSEFDLTN
jgi:hypothetical protein